MISRLGTGKSLTFFYSVDGPHRSLKLRKEKEKSVENTVVVRVHLFEFFSTPLNVTYSPTKRALSRLRMAIL